MHSLSINIKKLKSLVLKIHVNIQMGACAVIPLSIFVHNISTVSDGINTVIGPVHFVLFVLSIRVIDTFDLISWWNLCIATDNMYAIALVIVITR